MPSGEIFVLAPEDGVNVGEELAGGRVGVAPVAASRKFETKVGAVQGSGVFIGGEIFLTDKQSVLLNQVSTGA